MKHLNISNIIPALGPHSISHCTVHVHVQYILYTVQCALSNVNSLIPHFTAVILGFPKLPHPLCNARELSAYRIYVQYIVLITCVRSSIYCCTPRKVFSIPYRKFTSRSRWKRVQLRRSRSARIPLARRSGFSNSNKQFNKIAFLVSYRPEKATRWHRREVALKS